MYIMALYISLDLFFFFFSSRRRHTRWTGDWSSDVCSSDLDQATRQWMDGFIDYMTTKRGMADALRAVVASGGDPFAESLARLVGAITTLLGAGAAAGTIRADVEPRDVLGSSSGVALAAGPAGHRG